MKVLALLWLCVAALPAQANCRLALALALDVSSSVDEDEYRLQADGLAWALEDADVQAAFLGVPGATVALLVYEWSGRYQQAVLIDWMAVHSAADLTEVAAALRRARRAYEGYPTSMGYGLGFGAVALSRAPICARQVVDVSGDGINNDGFAPRLAVRHFEFDGVVINGLVVGGDTDVLEYYNREVIHGPGAFVEQATGFADFGAAMRRKLIREVSEIRLGSRQYAQPARR